MDQLFASKALFPINNGSERSALSTMMKRSVQTKKYVIIQKDKQKVVDRTCGQLSFQKKWQQK